MQVTSIPLGVLRDDETGEQIGIAVMETSLFEIPTVEASTPPLYATLNNGRYTEEITTTETNSSADKLILMLFPKGGATVADLRRNLSITPKGQTEPMELIDSVYDSDGNFINWEDANCVEIEDEEGEEKRAGLLVATDMSAASTQTFTVEAGCDFEYELRASGLPTTLNDDLVTVENARADKTYAIRYYYDTKRDLTGEHYYLGMDEEAPFSIIAPPDGGLAPTGDYYLTAVLVEKVVGDFNGDGKITEDEYAWITVDTKTSTRKYSYTNTLLPAAPASVDLAFTGNETLTASWELVNDADGYRVTLYYKDGSEWKQAGAPYELENADFGSKANPAATINGRTYSLRMAPTVHGQELEIGGVGTENPSVTGTGTAYDIAPSGVNYRATVESFKRDKTVSGEKGVLDTRYYSTPTKSGETELPAYTPKAITVTAGTQSVTLNAGNGYDTLTWSALPAVNETLFTITGDGSFTVTVEPDQGEGTFAVDPTSGEVTADAAGLTLIESSGRVKLTVTEGKDTTEYYLRLTLDDIAPIVTLDSENVAADPTTGKYTITGTTEPGLRVKLNTEPETTATAGVDGRFEIKGTLTKTNASEMTETAGFESLLGEVTAEDGAGNPSAPAAVVVTAREEWTPPEDPSSPSGGSSGGSKRANADKADKNKSPFRDVLDSDWFYEDVLFAHEEGLLTGTAKRTFSPYANTTRAMMATVLWRMDGEPEAKADSRFTDVAGGQWYSEAVAWADENGIVKGYGTGAFGTNDAVTREQFAAMLYRYAQYSGRVIQTGNDLTSFKDAARVSSWAQDAMLWAVHNGIITGKPGKLLDPQGTATRAEIAAMLRRFVKNTVYTWDVK